MRRSTVWLALVVALAGSGCLVASRESEEADALGPEVGDPGPTHRPNQPCLVCHSDRYDRGEKVFAVAGTVYQFATSSLGLPNATVTITDADDRVYLVHANDAGNFFLTVHGDLGADEERGEGELAVDKAPRYPLKISVEGTEGPQDMKSLVWRDGSCATCHTDPPGPTSAGRIFTDTP